MMRLSQADLRRAGYTVFGRDQYFVNSCGHGQEFITVPDTAGMWWLVNTVSGSGALGATAAGTRTPHRHQRARPEHRVRFTQILQTCALWCRQRARP